MAAILANTVPTKRGADFPGHLGLDLRLLFFYGVHLHSLGYPNRFLAFARMSHVIHVNDTDESCDTDEYGVAHI